MKLFSATNANHYTLRFVVAESLEQAIQVAQSLQMVKHEKNLRVTEIHSSWYLNNSNFSVLTYPCEVTWNDNVFTAIACTRLEK